MRTGPSGPAASDGVACPRTAYSAWLSPSSCRPSWRRPAARRGAASFDDDAPVERQLPACDLRRVDSDRERHVLLVALGLQQVLAHPRQRQIVRRRLTGRHVVDHLVDESAISFFSASLSLRRLRLRLLCARASPTEAEPPAEAKASARRRITIKLLSPKVKADQTKTANNRRRRSAKSNRSAVSTSGRESPSGCCAIIADPVRVHEAHRRHRPPRPEPPDLPRQHAVQPRSRSSGSRAATARTSRRCT